MQRARGRYRCVVFDLDGTLLDTRAAMMASIDSILGSLRRPAVSTLELEASMHHGLAAMLQRALAVTGGPPLDGEYHGLKSRLSMNYLATARERVLPFVGAEALLDELRSRATRLAVCTNQAEADARVLIEVFGLSRYFDEVVGRDTFAVHKPDPLPLIWLMGRCSAHPRDTLMVGDSEVDARCAQRAGVEVVLMEHGYGLTGFGAQHRTFRDFACLRQHLCPPEDGETVTSPALHGTAI